MAKPENLTGQEFGFLKTMEKAPDRVTPSGQKRKFWMCECRGIHAKNRQAGVKRSNETRKKISAASKGRDMSELQSLGTEAAKMSPKSGRFETNVNAKDWHLISPDGEHYYFHSLNFWLRENCENLFGFAPDSKDFYNAVSGLGRAKRSVMGKLPDGQRPGYSYKGWRVLPTNDDYK